MKQTGAESQILNKIDDRVLEILGRNSPSLVGLKVRDALTIPSTSENIPPIDTIVIQSLLLHLRIRS